VRGIRHIAVLWIVLAVSAHASTGRAQEPLVASDYEIDLVTTPVLGAGRIVGLGGAYTALADGIDGAPWNPAAYGSRTLWELDWFEWELTAGILFPGSFADNDFFNSGSDSGFRFRNFVFLSFGFRLQFGDFGFGSLPRLQLYELGDGAQRLSATFTVINYGLAYQLLDGQLVIGAGLRYAALSLARIETGESLVDFSGTGPEMGLLLRLAGQPWRLGVAGRLPVRSNRIGGDNFFLDQATGTGCVPASSGAMTCAGGIILPSEVHMPWEVQVGVAWQIGRRPLNRAFEDPDDAERELGHAMTMRQWEREREQVGRELGGPPPPTDPHRWLPRRARDPEFWGREQTKREEEEELLDAQIEEAEAARDREVRELSRLYLLISADLLITGPTDDGVGVEGFLAQERVESGRGTRLGARLGVEGEPWGNRLKLRAGTYLEPSRFSSAGYRLHATGGFDLRLFTWNLFGLFDDFDVRAGVTVDWAPRYFDWGVGVGFWH